MISELEKTIATTSSQIDALISKYFLKNLKKSDSNTFAKLNTNGSYSFGEKIKLFCDLVTISNLDKAKFKVYAKINSDMATDNVLHPNYLNNINNYYPFLMNTYCTSSEMNTIQEKLFSSIDLLAGDVFNLIKMYTEKPQIYYHKKAKNIFSS